jgi:predicted ATPase/signal transduction histidine kinase/GAF domain-containing protein
VDSVIEFSPGLFVTVREDREFTISRGKLDGDGPAVLLVVPCPESPLPAGRALLRQACALRSELDPLWAARPYELVEVHGQTALLIEDPGGEFLDGLLGAPLDVPEFLRLAAGIAKAIGQLHARDFIHQDIKPANLLVNTATGDVWLTGFGLSSRLPRHRQSPEPREIIVGTLAYMAPEQTGRMNRSVDPRSDLYSLGVTLYEMLVGTLPFTASDPMELIHCHIARSPDAPKTQVSEIPEQLSAIVMKLLAKAPEERYQTAAGLEDDLRRCLAGWEADGRVELFPLGAHDVSDQLLIPQKLYGREKAISSLLQTFERVASDGLTEFVLVSGYSGIGKSSVVNELQKELVPSRGLFASGKFDQFKRDIPYATLGQAFRSLVRQILTQSNAEVLRWRTALQEALGTNGQLIVNLVPEIELIIGQQPPVADLPAQDAQNRFQMVFRRFLGVFGSPKRPLTLFLDDLQWLDPATLDLLEHLVTHAQVRHLLLVGAYRDNEVGPAHPLLQTLKSIREAEARVHEIVLAPLGLDDIVQLIAESLHCLPEHATPLAKLVREKTSGNPFFVIQFLTALAEEKLLEFDQKKAAWSWELAPIKAKRYTDSGVELVAEKLARLPDRTLGALRQLASLGNVAQLGTVTWVLGESETAIHSALGEAVRAGLVFYLENAYTFCHERVREAAYALIPETERAAVHLRIGRILASLTPAIELEEKIFEIVNQLNRGAALIVTPEERVRVAELNLIAGKRAKTSTAYTSALTYLAAGTLLLGVESWEQLYELTFELEFQQAECEFLTGDFAAAENRLSMLSEHARNLIDRAAVARLRTELFTTLDQNDRAVEVGLTFLRGVGVDWSPHPTKDEVRQEYERIRRRLDGRPIETLVDLPSMTDPGHRATLDVLTVLEEPAHFIDENLRCLVLARMVNLSLEHGNSDGSCVAYVHVGWLVGPRFGDHEAAYRFGKLGLDLVEKRGLERFRARVSQCFGYFVIPWSRHLRTGLELLRRSFSAAQEAGDLKYATYFRDRLVTLLLAAGDPLSDVQREAEQGFEFARKAKFGYIADILDGQLRLTRTLRGLTPGFSSSDAVESDDDRFGKPSGTDPRRLFATCWYWIRKLQACVIAQDYVMALAASDEAAPFLVSRQSEFETAEYLYYDALARAGKYDSASSEERLQYREKLAVAHRKIGLWAENCPENFRNRQALIGAEIARIEGRELDAQRLYEQAIRAARENGFAHNEGIANERAAQFYLARGYDTSAHAYLQNARSCYLRWGALGKVRQLDQIYPHLQEERTPASSTATIGTPVEQLDMGTVIKASHAVSGEIVLEKLIETLLLIAVEHAGAERGLLILVRNDELRIEAQATTVRGRVEVTTRPALVTPSELPESVLHYVIRTRESVVLDDATGRSLYSEDEYLLRRRPRSILCLPIVKQTKLAGALYLENNMTPRAFTPDRIAVLELLASQAAISLENARLYSDLERENLERKRAEDELRRSEGLMSEGQRISRTGSWDWNIKTGKLIWSTEQRRMFGLVSDADEVTFDYFAKMIHPADRSYALKTIDDAVRVRGAFDQEFRIVLPNGGVTYVQGSGRPVVQESGEVDEYIGVSMDVTEQKWAEEELRRSEANLRKVQGELAHVTRVTTMGELAASIAHEVNQPIAGVVLNGNACLRWLARVKEDSVNLTEAREALQRIIRDGSRAGEVIARIRTLFKKTGTAKGPLDLNEAIREVIVLARSEMDKKRITRKLQLADDLPRIVGDRVQLQQVMLNLILNAIEAMSIVEDRSRELVAGTRLHKETEVLVTIRDSGPGLDPESIERAFTAFYTTKPGGLGMGLSISRSIVESHAGRLWAVANDGPGATFQFTLSTDSSEDPVEGEP